MIAFAYPIAKVSNFYIVILKSARCKAIIYMVRFILVMMHIKGRS